jgi:hypothetical protein
MHAILLISTLTAAGDEHLAANPVYRHLRQEGIAIHDKFAHALPAPTLVDGLNAQEHEAVIRDIAGRSFPVSMFTRESVVAPHILRMRVIDSSEPQRPGRFVQFWFVTYGELETVIDKEFLEGLLVAGESERQEKDEGVDLVSADLEKRNIALASENKDCESYSHTQYSLIERVRLSMTVHSFWSRTSDSIVAAARVDPRFQGDEEFPNSWRRIAPNERGERELGPPSPYVGAGLYAKISRLRWPQGALFIECHVVFSEPHGWFDGHNLLGSKLPRIVQSCVRSARRNLMKADRP